MKIRLYFLIFISFSVHSNGFQNQRGETAVIDVDALTGATGGYAFIGALTQSFVTRATAITKISIWGTNNATMTLTLRDALNGNPRGSANANTSGVGILIDFAFQEPIEVTPFQTYYIEVQAPITSNWGAAPFGYYNEGYAYINAIPHFNGCFLFRTEGFLAPPNATTENCARQVYDGGDLECTARATEVAFFKPNSLLQLCTADILRRELNSSSVSIDFVVYESQSNDLNANYTKISSSTRSGTIGNIILRGITDPLVLRPDRYYAIGLSCSYCFLRYPCNGSSFSSPDISLVANKYSNSRSTFAQVFNFDSFTDDITSLNFRFYLSVITNGTTGSHVTTATMTSSSVTTQSATSETNDTSSSSNAKTLGGAIGGTLAVILLLGILVVTLFILKRRLPKSIQKDNEKGINKTEQEVELKPATAYQSFNAVMGVPSLTEIDITRKLGSGSYGEVFLGEWRGTKVALKKLKDEDRYEEFLKEVATLSQVIHPNCVQFLGLYNDNGEQYLVMEYLSNGALKNVLLDHRAELTVADLLKMCIGAAKGLAYLESKNIVHRDVALRNLLAAKTDGGYTSKVSDFGMSRSTTGGEYSVKSEVKLPVKWTAPEVLGGQKFTVKNDVWAFGITMWEIFSFGQEPYAWLSNREAFQEIQQGEKLPQPRDCRDEIYQIMTRCWAMKPEERPTFVELVKMLSSIRNLVLKEHPEWKRGKQKKSADNKEIQANTVPIYF